MARHLEIGVRLFSIRPRPNECGGGFRPDQDSLGRLTFDHSRVGTARYDAHGFRIRMILVAMGGPMAEARCEGHEDWRVLDRRRFFGSDRDLASSHARLLAFQGGCDCRTRREGRGSSFSGHDRCIDRLLDRVSPWAAGEIELVWDAIEAVVMGLFDEEELNRDDLDRIVSRVGGLDPRKSRQRLKNRLGRLLDS
jgi:hypothetical protein